MIILKIHVENYGKISGFDKAFGGGINEVFENNGFGKTTLASFIKAMFYGLAPYRSNGKEFNDRRKFYPFNGGKFGGSLDFEYNGDNYRIERFFGKKSDLDDECKIYKNSVPTSELDPVPGLKVLGLDEESFVRTLFIDSEIADISSTGTINGLLGEFVTDSDGVSYEDALSKLEAARKKYRAAKGNNDLISNAKAEISDLKTKIENIEKEGLALENYYAELKKLTETEKELSVKLKEASSKNVEIEKWKTYRKLKADEEGKLAELKAYAEKYPRGIPDEKEIARTDELVSTVEKLRAKRESLVFAEDKKVRLQAYTRTFASGTPSDDAFRKLNSTISEITLRKNEIENLKGKENARETELDKKFKDINLSAALENAERAAENFREKEEIYRQSIAIAPAQSCRNEKKSGGFAIVSAIVSFAILVAGLILAFAVGGNIATVGYIAAAVGLIGLALSVVLIVNGNKNRKKTQDNTESMAKIRADVDLAGENLREILVPLGYYSRNGVMFDYAKFKAEADEYFILKNESASRRKMLAEKSEQVLKATESVRNFLSRFLGDADENDLENEFFRLKNMVAEYRRLFDEQSETAKKYKAAEAEELEAKKEISAFFNRYGLLVNDDEKKQLKNLEADLSNILRLKNECVRLKNTAADYREKNNLAVEPTGEVLSTDELSSRFNLCQRAIAVKRSEISAAESVYETLSENKNKLAIAEENLKTYNEKREIIALAEVYLKAADEKLQQKYVAPVKDAFVKYSLPLEKALGEKIVMNKDFRIFFESGGEIRDDKHLSSGQRCILSLCFRLSLIENAFGDEKPFLIMDDPFVNLDKEHIAKVTEFLKEIAKNEQIIYFCCHESRRLL